MKTRFLIFIALIFYSTNSFCQNSFSEQAWISIAPLYPQIKHHPFNQELASGKLDPKKFTFYKEQDSIYLIQFSKTLSLLATKPLLAKEKEFMKKLSESITEDEADPSVQQTSFMSLANFAYIQYLQVIGNEGRPEEILAAILPCFWIYEILAQDLKKKMSSQNPYESWINYYSSKKYHQEVQRIIQITNRYLQNVSPTKREKALQIFRTATALELRFWDDAYKLRKL